MSMYYPGMHDAIAKVDHYDQETCLRHIDALYGRDKLKFGDGLNEIRDELRAQLKREYTKPESEWSFHEQAFFGSGR